MVINSSRNSVLVGGLYCDRLLSNYPRKSISIRLEVISFPDENQIMVAGYSMCLSSTVDGGDCTCYRPHEELLGQEVLR